MIGESYEMSLFLVVDDDIEEKAMLTMKVSLTTPAASQMRDAVLNRWGDQ